MTKSAAPVIAFGIYYPFLNEIDNDAVLSTTRIALTTNKLHRCKLYKIGAYIAQYTFRVCIKDRNRTGKSRNVIEKGLPESISFPAISL